MTITLTGNNRQELSERLAKLVADFIKENGELAVERLDGEEAQAQAVIDAVQSLPFLSEKKLVIVRNFGASKQADKLEQILSSVADSTDLVFYEIAPDKRSSVYKTLKSKTQFEEFNTLDSRSLPKWLVERAKEYGGSLSLADANFLINRVGDNQQLLASELEKLIIYDSKISRETIDLLTVETPQSKIFDLLDAAFAGNKKRALGLYEEQRAQKVEPQEIMAMLAWQLRLLTLAKLGQGKSSAEIAKDAGLSSFPVSKAQSLAAKLSLAKVREMVAEAEKIDRLSKTKSIDLDEALKSYIATL